MKRPRSMKHLLLSVSTALLSMAVIIAPLASLPHEVADAWNWAWARLLPSVSASSSPEHEVQAAWRRAQQAGAYHYTTDIVQTTYPAPALVNVGRSSRKETLHIEGQTNLPEHTLLMTLWKEGGSLLNPRDGIEMRVEGDRAYGRAIGGTWEEMDDFSGAFAPGNDLMAYLAGAKNVKREDVKRENMDSRFTFHVSRFTFDVDGPAFAEHLRDQLEHHLREQGELPLGLSLDVSNRFRAMTGQGEVWIDSNGLPLRLTVHLDYPEQRNGERIEADIKTDFRFSIADFRLTASSENDQSAIRSGLLHTPHNWHRAGRQTALAAAFLGLVFLLITCRRSRKVYTATVVAVLLSMIVTPLLQSHQVHAFSQRLAARRAEQEQRQKEAEATRELREELLISDWDPHRDPLLALSPVEGSVISDQSSPRSKTRNPRFTIPNIQYPTSAALSATDDEDNDGLTTAQEQHPLVGTDPTDPDSDDDGLTDGQEVLRLGTDPKTEDSDGDGITDYVEVQGFHYNSNDWHLDPNNPDSNNDGQLDTVECSDLVNLTSVGSRGCTDTDGDGTPDAFDRDNDDDSVPDPVDLSPNRSMDRTGNRYHGYNPFTRDDSFELKVQNLNTGYPVFVNFQLRPVVTDHLAYALNVLDWPSGDTEGQIQRVKDTTFATTDNPGAQDTVNPRSQNGDMRLIPMLEITMPYDDQNPSGNLPVKDGAPAIGPTTPITAWLDAGELQPYGISVRKKDDVGNLLAYVPLNLVKGETGGGKEAFSARMLYWPNTSTWGNNHQVRVVWVVQMLTDWCDEEGFAAYWEGVKEQTPGIELVAGAYTAHRKAWCAKPEHRMADEVQIVHTYYDDWYLTGLSVREDHGLDVAIAYEDPTTDEDPQTDDWLWQLARGLGVTFAAGRDCDDEDPQNDPDYDPDNNLCHDDGKRDITVVGEKEGEIIGNSTISSRFDHADRDGDGVPDNDGVSETERWAIRQDALLVETFSYPHQDYIAHIMMTETVRILDQFAQDTTPSLLFAREEHYRSADLAMGSWINQALTIDAGPATSEEETIASLSWAPYRFRDGAWEPYPIREYWDQLDIELKDLFRQLFPDDSEDINLGKMVVARSYYVSLLQGLAAQVQSGEEVLWTPESGQVDSDAGLVNTVAELIGGTGIQPGGGGIVWTVVNEVTDASLKHLRKSGGYFVPKYISKTVYEPGGGAIVSMNEEVLSAIVYKKRDSLWKSLGRGIRKYVVSDWAKLFKGGVKKAVGAGVALAGAITAVGLTIYATSTSTGIDVAVSVVNGLNLIMAIHGAVQTATKVIKAVHKAGTFAKAAADGFAKATKEIAKAFKSAAVIGLVIAVTATWGSFIAQMVLTKTDFGSLAFNAALAGAIASTVVLVIMFAIAAIPVVGQIISAVVTAIDAVINLLCGAFDWEEGEVGQYVCKGISGWLAEGIKWAIYSATVMVDMSDANRLQVSNFDQDLVTSEKGLSVGSEMEYSASITSTINLVSIPVDWKAAAYWHQYSDNTLRSSTFQYKWQTAKDDFHEDLHRKMMMGQWHPTNGKRPFFIAKPVVSDGIPLSEAGINRPVRLYLSEGYAVPTQECWAVPIPFMLPPGIPFYSLEPVCYIRTEKATNHIDMGKNLLFDVFPETLDRFYKLTPKQGGLALAWGQDGHVVFPSLRDADGDGLLNKAAGGSDPDDSLWDSDYDGLSDLYEFQNGTDPLNADSDFDGYRSDGLSDYDEMVLGTNPNRLDTDGDGLLDGEELDGWEYVCGFTDDGAPLRTWVISDPTEGDEDGDGLTDFLEKTYGFHPRVFSDPTILTFESEVREVAAPKLLLRFEEEAGATTFSDISGHDNHGTCSGDSCPTAGVRGRHGYAIQFDDGSEEVTAPGEGIDEAQELTVAAWVKLHSLPPRWMRFVTLRNNKALLAYREGNLSFRVMIGGQLRYVELPDTFQTGTFYHVAGTYDGSQLRLYLNGQEVASLSVTGQVGIGNGVLLSIDKASEFLDGVLDEVVIFDRALSTAEISDVMAGRYNPNDLRVKGKDVLDYRASVKNELFNRYAQGLLSTDFPAAVSSAVPPKDFILYPLEEQMMAGYVEVDDVAPSGVYSLTQVAGALITDWRELAGGAQVWLPFEDPNTFEDRSGSQPPHHGTCVGNGCPPGREQGKYGQALKLNGNAYVEAPLDLSDGYAVSLWFKTDCANCGIASLPGENYWDRSYIYLENGKVCAVRRSSGLESRCTPGTGSYADGQWHHVVHTYGGGADGQEIYVDGLWRTGDLDWPPGAGWPTEIRIGHSTWAANDYFHGAIDDLRVFDKRLGPDEVQALFGQPIFDMRFDYPLENGASWLDDSIFQNGGGCSPPNCPNSVSGISGKSVSFDGTDYIQVEQSNPSLDLSNGQFTIAAWVYPEDYPNNDNRNIARQGILGRDSGQLLGYPTLQRTGSGIYFGFGTGSVWEGNPFYVSALSPDAWNHVVVTFGPTYDQNGDFISNVAMLYVNGQYQAQSSFASKQPISLPADAISRPFMIGRSSNEADIYIGHIGVAQVVDDDEDEFAELCMAFNETEIFNRGSIHDNDDQGLAYNVKWGDMFPETGRLVLWDDDGGTRCGSQPDDNDDVLFDRTFTTNNDLSHFSKTYGFSGDTDVRGYIYLSYFNNSIPLHGQMDEVRIYKRVLDPGEVEELYWAGTTSLHLPFDEAPGERVFQDATGQHDGACSGTACPTAGVAGRLNQAALFESNDYVAAEVDVSETTYAVSLWFKTACDACGIFSVDKGTRGSEGHDRHLYLQNGNLCARVYDHEIICTSGTNYADGQWHHVVHTFGGAVGSQKIYVDGIQKKSGSIAASDFTWQTGVNIGFSNDANSSYFNGDIDDVRVFHQALSADQVQRLYSEAPRFQMHFDEALGATQFADNSGNGNDGACSGDTCPSAGLKGRIGSAVEFDGYDDVVTVPDDPDLDLNEFTVGAWVMPTAFHDYLKMVVNKGNPSKGYNYQLSLYDDKVSYKLQADNCVTTYGDWSEGSLIQNTWNHVMMSFDGYELKLYLNGSFDGSVELPSYNQNEPLCHNNQPIRIGRAQNWSGFGGRIDEVTIYDHALTAREVRDIFQYQAKWVEEWQSHDVTVDADKPTSELCSDGPYLAQQDVVMHIEAHDPTSSVALVKLGIQGPSQGSYTWTGAPRCMDASSDAAWCPTFEPSGEGRYRFQTRAIDQVGNQEQPPSGPVTIYMDGTPPVVTSDLADGDVVGPVPHPSLEKTWIVHLSGTVSDPQLPDGYAGSSVLADSVKVTLFASDGTIGGQGMQAATVNGNQWAVDYLFSEVKPSGQYTLRVEAADQVGNQTEVPTDTDLVTFYMDATAPAANLDLADLPTILTGAVTLEGDATEHPVPIAVSWTTGDDGHQVGLAIECDGLTLYSAAPGVLVAQTTYTWDGVVHRGLNCQVNVTGGVVSGTVEVCGSEVANWDGGTGVSFTADSQACGANLPVAGLEKVEIAFRPTLPGSPFYNETPPEGQLLHLPFEDTRTISDTLTFRDISAQAHVGECEGDSCPAVGAPGHTGSAARFDGLDDCIEIVPAGDLRLTDQGTLAAWIYPTGAGSGIVINKEGEYEVVRYADGTIRWAFANEDPGWTWPDTGYVAPLNQWTHIVVVYDAGVIQTYANGTLVHTYSGSGNIRPADDHNFSIGGRKRTSEYFEGVIDEVHVFDRVLSADEIRSLYLGCGPVLALPFDEPWATDSATVLDDSGWEHDGTLNTGDAINKAVPGKVGAYALRFDGLDDSVSVTQSHDLDRYDTVSIAAWIYPTGTGSGGQQGGIVVNKEGEFEIARFGDGTIHWAFNNDDPGWGWQSTGYEAPLNQWTHVAVAYDAGVVQTFANGTLVHTYEGSGSLPYHDELRIGGRAHSSQHFDGLIDDVHIYPRALSELEVQALYDGAWQEASLIDVGSGVDRKGWSFQVPEGLEGDYQIDLRGWDTFGNVDSAQGRNVWRGSIDSLAPRTTLDHAWFGQSPGTFKARYQCSAQDFNLTEEGHDSPCRRSDLGREYFTAPWYVALSGDNPDGSKLCGLTGYWRQLVAYVDTPSFAQGVSAYGDFACLTDEHAGLQVMQVQGVPSPKEVGALELATKAWDVFVAEDSSGSGNVYAYVAAWVAPPPPPPNRHVVNSTGDGEDSDLDDKVCNDGTDHCTLRAAIQQVNRNAVAATIEFDIPGAGPHTIRPDSELPPTAYPVVVDGTTQEGTSCTSGILMIELDGTNAGDGATGLQIMTSSSTVRGLVINNFKGNGMVLSALLARSGSAGDGGLALGSEAGVTVACNFIGTEPDGVTDAGNGGHGVYVDTSDNTIGGAGAGEGNTIAYNDGDGVFVSSGISNAIISNSIFANGGLGIDLSPDGVTPNDPDDPDTGPNNRQNFPEMSFAGVQDGQLDIRYRVPSTTTNSTYPLTIEFFLADADDQEGQTLIGSDPYYWEGIAGQTRSFRFTPAVPVVPGDKIVATATDDDGRGNTSEFSPPITVRAVTNLHVVNSVDDDEDSSLDDGVCDIGNGGCTLRAAIQQANANLGTDTVEFNISGTGPHTIHIESELPTIYDAVIISGTTQPGASCISGDLRVVLDGTSAGDNADGLKFETESSTVRGLVINNFKGNGIVLKGLPTRSRMDGRMALADGSGVTVQCNFVGTEPDGVTDAGNGGHGVHVAWLGNTIGGTGARDGNVIAHNDGDGVFVSLGVGNHILSNSIFANAGLGIDLAPDSVTPNDPDDSDSGPNNLQNFPKLNYAVAKEGQLEVQYQVPSTYTNSTYPLWIEFFIVDADDQEGQTFIGSELYQVTDAGKWKTTTFTPTVPVTVDVDRVVATATDADGNTSEFSSAIFVTSEIPESPPEGLSDGRPTSALSITQSTAGWSTEQASLPSPALSESQQWDGALYVVDVTDPISPTQVKKLEAPGVARDVFVADGPGGRTYAYVAASGAGLWMVDVSRPVTPTSYALYDTPGLAHGVYVAGDYAFVADGNEGLRVMNVLNPAAGPEVGFYDTPGLAHDVVVSGTHAYVADGEEGLCIIDVSDPTSPEFVNAYDTPGFAGDVTMSGNYAYVADGYRSGLIVLDVSDPANPREVISYKIAGSAQGVVVVEESDRTDAYLAAWTAGLAVVPEPVPHDLKVCDTAGNCSTASALGSPGMTNLSGAVELADGPAPDVVISAPTTGTVLTSTAEVNIIGGAYAPDYLRTLTVTVGSTPIETLNWDITDAVSETIWSVTWNPSLTLTGEGAHHIEVLARDWAGHTASDQITVILDTEPPTLTMASTVFTTTHYHASGRLELTGTVSDTGGVASVDVEISRSPTLSGTARLARDAWFYAWYEDVDNPPDGTIYNVTARATDIGGHTAEVSGTVTVDVVPPAPVTLTMSSNGRVLTPTMTLTETTPVTLTLEWTASSSSDLSCYHTAWTAQTTSTVNTTSTVHSPATLSDEYAAGEGQKVTAQVGSQDTLGNQAWQSWGSIYVDSPHTPDYVVLDDLDGIYHGWMESGCTLIGVDRRIERHAPDGAALSAEQKLYATWNTSAALSAGSEALRLAWTGANWNTDGDLFIYLDTQGGGTSQVYNPYPATPDTVIHLPGVTPSSQANAMLADYLVWVQDSDTAALLSWGSDWSFVTELSAEQYQFDAALNDGHTDIYLPFNLIGISDPAAASLDLVAFAAEQDALSLWAVMPNANAVNSGKVIATAPYTRGDEEFALSHRYHWESLGAGLCPNGSDLSTPTRYPDTDLYVSISAEPAGTAYSFLGDDLFWLWDLLFGDDLPDVSSFFTFMDTDHPRVGPGQEIVYTINYRNQGTDTATGVWVDVSAYYALHLPDGGPPDYNHQVVTLGNVAPGAEGTATFRGVVDLPPGEDWAAVEALVYDAAHDPSGPPLDWIWIDHQVDRSGPEFFGIQQPTYLLRAGTNRLRGYAYDDSGVPLITLEIAPLGLGASVLPCPDATPDDGTWSCAWDATGSNDGDQFKVQLQATDGFSQTSELRKAQTFVVDAALPTVTLDVTATKVFSGSLVRGNAFTLIGDVFDDGGVAQVDVCVDGDCGQANLQLAAGATTVIYDDVPESPIVIDGGGIVRNFEVAENFAIGQVSLGFTADHPHRDDIQVELQSPDGTIVRVLDDDGISGTEFQNYDVFLNDAAPMGPQDAAGDDDPANHFYERLVRPHQPLRTFLGESSAGTWTLRLRDLDPSSNDGSYRRSRLVLMPRDTNAKSARWIYRTSGTGELDYVAQTVSTYGEDVVGNRTTDPLTLIVWVDNVPPEITVNSAIAEITLGSTETILSGTVTDGGPATYVSAHILTPRGERYRQRAGRDGDDWWVALDGRYPGRHTVWLIASDEAGNSTLEGPFQVDVVCTAADLTATFLSAELTVNSPFSITITAVISNTGHDDSPAGLPVGFYVYDTRIGMAATTRALGPGQSETISLTWDVDFPGDYDITIVPNAGPVEAGPPVFCSLTSSARQMISILDVPLVESWNLVSTYVNPFNTDASVVQRPIEGQYVVIQGFDEEGAKSYYPDLPPEVNTLEDMDGEHGYWVKIKPFGGGGGMTIAGVADVAATLRVVGETFAEDRPTDLDAEWNLVSYLPRRPLAVADALQSVDGQYTAVLGYDQGALSYYPDIDPSFNTLHEMEPLFGYWIRMPQAGTLQYPTTGDQILDIGYSRSPTANTQYPIPNIRQVERSAGVTPTNTWVNFYGTVHGEDGVPLPVGTTVQALDPDGVVCGATVITTEGQYGLLACYGDDPTTPEDEGAHPGDIIQLVVDVQVLGTGTWTAHGDRQWRPLGKADLWQVYLPLTRKGAR